LIGRAGVALVELPSIERGVGVSSASARVIMRLRGREEQMMTVYYTAKVRGSRLLELPEEAQQLGLQPGEEVGVTFHRNSRGNGAGVPPNEGMLAALAEIGTLNDGRASSDASDTQRLLREARSGAMYGSDLDE
jgi:hypothetical protein